MIITHNIQAMKMYFFNSITKTRTQEATLTYSHYEVIPVSKVLCPNSYVSFISEICPPDCIQNILGIPSIPQNHLNKIQLKFSDEVIVNFLIFLFEIYKKKSKYNVKEKFVIVFVKMPFYYKDMPYIRGGFNI